MATAERGGEKHALPGNGMAYDAMERRGGAMQRKSKDQSCSARQCNGMAQSEMQGEGIAQQGQAAQRR